MLKKFVLLFVFVFLLASCGSSSDSDGEPVSEVKATATQRPENTATSKPQPTNTDEPEPTATDLPTATATLEPTATPEPTETPTPEPTATHTPLPTATPEPTLLIIVTDSESGAALAGATIELIYDEGGATQTLTTDASGEVLFELFTGYDSYKLSVSADGYGTQNIVDDLPLAPTTIEIALEGRVVAEVTVSSVNLRAGPSTAYATVATATEGDELQVMGQNDAGTWLVVLLEDGQEAWVSKTVVNLSVEDELLAVIDSPPPPPPTSTPAATAVPPTATPVPSNFRDDYRTLIQRSKSDVQQIGGLIDRLYHGEGATCMEYVGYFDHILMMIDDFAAQYPADSIPPEWQTSVSNYVGHMYFLIDKHSGIINFCIGEANGIDPQVWGPARQSVDTANDFLHQTLQQLQ